MMFRVKWTWVLWSLLGPWVLVMDTHLSKSSLCHSLSLVTHTTHRERHLTQTHLTFNSLEREEELDSMSFIITMSYFMNTNFSIW